MYQLFFIPDEEANLTQLNICKVPEGTHNNVHQGILLSEAYRATFNTHALPGLFLLHSTESTASPPHICVCLRVSFQLPLPSVVFSLARQLSRAGSHSRNCCRILPLIINHFTDLKQCLCVWPKIITANLLTARQPVSTTTIIF